MQLFRGVLALKAHRLLYHSTLGLNVIKKKKQKKKKKIRHVRHLVETGEVGQLQPEPLPPLAPVRPCPAPQLKTTMFSNNIHQRDW